VEQFDNNIVELLHDKTKEMRPPSKDEDSKEYVEHSTKSNDEALPNVLRWI